VFWLVNLNDEIHSSQQANDDDTLQDGDPQKGAVSVPVKLIANDNAAQTGRVVLSAIFGFLRRSFLIFCHRKEIQPE
jgi:hypothetical protein